jgi:hypothetical protein
MSARKQATVTRDYKYEAGDCIRALELLLKKPGVAFEKASK